MAPRRLKIHRSVYNYRKCQDDRSSLDDVTDFDKILGKPVGRRRAMERTVHNAQTVLAEVLEAVDGLEHEQVRWELQDAFTDFFGKPFNEERWKRVHAKLKCLAPFADNPNAVDLIIHLGDDHLFEADVTIIESLKTVHCVVDTTCEGIFRKDGINYVPAKATYPLDLSKEGGFKRPNVQAYIVGDVAAGWEHHPFEPLKMIFISPTAFKQKETNDADAQEDTEEIWTGMHHIQGPVELNDGREIEDDDPLPTICGAPMILIHELLHSHLMKADGGQPLDDEIFELDGAWTEMYGDYNCWRAAESPENADACENNADSYTFFIAQVYKELQLELTLYGYGANDEVEGAEESKTHDLEDSRKEST